MATVCIENPPVGPSQPHRTTWEFLYRCNLFETSIITSFSLTQRIWKQSSASSPSPLLIRWISPSPSAMGCSSGYTSTAGRVTNKWKYRLWRKFSGSLTTHLWNPSSGSTIKFINASGNHWTIPLVSQPTEIHPDQSQTENLTKPVMKPNLPQRQLILTNLQQSIFQSQTIPQETIQLGFSSS